MLAETRILFSLAFQALGYQGRSPWLVRPHSMGETATGAEAQVIKDYSGQLKLCPDTNRLSIVRVSRSSMPRLFLAPFTPYENLPYNLTNWLIKWQLCM